MATTANLDLDLIAANQNQKHVTANATFRKLDALCQLSVIDRDLTAPPGSPAEGDRYIVAATAAGAWAGWEKSVAGYQDGAWVEMVPKEGWLAWVQDENLMLVYDGTSWTDFTSTSFATALSNGTFDLLGINGNTADTTNRLSVSTPGVLFDAETADFALTTNKAAAGDDNQILFQTAFSTRAQVGLVAGDDFKVRVSPDGSSFFDGIVIDKDNGNVSFGGGAASTSKLDVRTTETTSHVIASLLTNGTFNEVGGKIGVQVGRSFDSPDRLTEFGYGSIGGFGESPFFYVSVGNDAGALVERMRVRYDGNVGIGNSGDANNRLSVTGDAILFNAETDDMLATFNKVLAADDVSFAFQQGFTTQVQFGLLGDNNLSIKVGASSTLAVTVDTTTAAVAFDQHPKFSAYLDFGQNYTAGAWRDLLFNNFRHNDQGDAAIATNVLTFTAPHDGYYMFAIGATFESGAGTPDEMQVGVSINGANPTGDRLATTGDAAFVSGETAVYVTALLKLSASDTVNPKIFFTTNDGRVLANENYFWGCQIV